MDNGYIHTRQVCKRKKQKKTLPLELSRPLQYHLVTSEMLGYFEPTGKSFMVATVDREIFVVNKFSSVPYDDEN